ncbi:MAG: GAF domain-containing protein [Clostridia bacterium]|nr:GAF domain-containing protein [Clostridia bacterium]
MEQKAAIDTASAARELVRGVPHLVSNLANVAALIFNGADDISWAGFYLMEEGKLVLGPFQGKPACIEIPLGRGVCGTAAAEDRVIAVDDVHSFPGHIACDPDSASELVIPLHKDGKAFAVLDLDSCKSSRFAAFDIESFTRLARVLEEELFA